MHMRSVSFVHDSDFGTLQPTAAQTLCKHDLKNLASTLMFYTRVRAPVAFRPTLANGGLRNGGCRSDWGRQPSQAFTRRFGKELGRHAAWQHERRGQASR